MTFLLLQAFLLMAASYFLGAFLGCWWRRAFYQEPEIAHARTADAVIAGTGGSAAVATPATSLTPAETIPVQPRIEYSSTQEGVGDATRFGRALSGVGTMADPLPRPAKPAYVGVVTPPPAPAKPIMTPKAPPPAPAEPVLVSPPAAAKIEVKPAPHAVAPPAVASPIATVQPAAERKTDSAVSAAAAAAAAAMAIAATRPKAEEPAKPAAAPPQPAKPAPVVAAPPQPTAPAAPPASEVKRPQVASSGGSGVAADVRTAPLVPADRQDLKLIRGIDEVTERTLHSQGIWRYNDIARWSAKDVAAANRVLSTKGRVERENWIEQAALLAGGGLTDFARRRLRGEHAAAKPSAVATPSRPVVASTPAQVAPLVAGKSQAASPPSAAASAVAAAVAAAAAAAAGSRGVAGSERKAAVPQPQAVRPIVTAPVATPPAAPPAAVPPVAVAPARPAPAVTPAAPVVPGAATVAPAASAAPVSQPAVSATADQAAASPAVAEKPAAADLLQRIRGIDAGVERLLVGEGVRHYRQIAGWTSADVDRFEGLLGSAGRIGRENWIEQAQILAGGAATQFARQHDAGMQATPAAEPASLRPARLSDAIRDQQDRDTKPLRNDVSGLRSVRSEALRPAPAEAPRIGGTARPAAPDDLKRIRGIGVLIEKKLNSLGVSSYDQIANWTADDIAHVSDVLDFRGRIERENWVEQARILTVGGQTEFSRRVDRGEIQ